MTVHYNIITEFVCKVLAVVKEYFHKKHEIVEEKEKRNLSMRYDDLKQKAESLKTQLEEVCIVYGEI